jgi:hypothetical protein
LHRRRHAEHAVVDRRVALTGDNRMFGGGGGRERVRGGGRG